MACVQFNYIITKNFNFDFNYNYSYLYQIAHLGDEDDEPEFSSAMPLEEGDTFFFAPRQLKNLVVVDELPSYAPIIGNYIFEYECFNHGG